MVAQWLWHCAAEQEVAGTIPDQFGGVQKHSCAILLVHIKESQVV